MNSLRMGGFSTFWCFWMKLGVVDCVSRAAMVVEGSVVSEEVTDAVNVEKMARFGEISLVGSIFMFVWLLESTGEHNVDRQVGESISEHWDVLVSLWMLVVAREGVPVMGGSVWVEMGDISLFG